VSLINLNEIAKKIVWHESQISALKQLRDLAPLLENDAPVRRGRKPGAVTKKAAAKGVKGRKRGAITDAILAMLESANAPVPSGAIRSALEAQGVIAKGSTTIYSQLQQMAKRGLIVKKGEGFSMGAGKAARKKPGRKKGGAKPTTAKAPKAPKAAKAAEKK
jgi:hypothetical protein